MLEPFYAFESGSRFIFGPEPPKYSHLIIFFKVKLNQKCSEIKLKLDPMEVDGALWLSEEQISKVFSLQDEVVEGHIPSDNAEEDRLDKFKLA